MDQAEAAELGVDFEDITTLQKGGLDIEVFKRVFEGITGASQHKSERIIREEYDKKIKDINNNITKLMTLS